ncbi:MAG: hypothetical protein IJ668_06155 [Selenomonadaceae bacterium]|nr:hypothetical protein [Selenomonadaceae bacterium]
MQINWNEYVLRYTEPGGKIYYIIRRADSLVGLFSNYIVFAGHIRYALANGWLPVIDMKNYPNTLLEPRLLGKLNAWEYYFCQPFNITLDEAYNARNVIMGSGDVRNPFPSGHNSIGYYNNVGNVLNDWRMLVKLGMLRIQPKILEDIMEEYNRLISKEDRVLGTLVRGTDYVALRPMHHSVQPPVEAVIDTARKLLEQWKCNKIFLATEDFNIVNRFKEAFKDKCIVTDRQYIKYDGRAHLGFYHINRENDYFLLGKEYLTQMVILSKCNCLLTSMCSGAAGMMMMADGFEQAVVFDLGKYGVSPVITPPHQ